MSWNAKTSYPISSGIAFQTLIELNNGKILSVGGEHTTAGVEVLENNCYLYDPALNTWTITGARHTLCVNPLLVKLNDGRILATGGRTLIVSGDPITATEIYDPNTGQWTVTGSLNVGRYRAAIWKLANGDVLIAGGGTGAGSFTPVSSTERYSIVGGTWTNVGQSLPQTVIESYFFSLNDGTPVIAGGQHSSTGFDGSFQWHSGSGWTSLTAQPIGLHASDTGQVLILSNGDVMIAGAASNAGGSLNNSVSTALIFHQNSNTWETVGNLNNRRQDCILGALPNGAAFVSSGFVDPFSAVFSGEVYDPLAKTWSLNSNYALSAQQTFATYFQTEQGVFVIGGWDFTQPLVNNLEPAMVNNQFFLTNNSTPNVLNADDSSYILRYNLILDEPEYFRGADWYPQVVGSSGITTLTGDVSASGSGSVVATLVSTGVTPGSYTNTNLTVDTKGRITTASNGSGGSGITTLTGDVTAGPGSGSQAATLATVNGNVGSFTSANITVNAKGLITAASNGTGGSGALLKRSSISTTTSNTTSSNTYVDTDLTLSYTSIGAGHDMDLIVSGVLYLSTGGDTVQVTIAVDGNNTTLVSAGMQEYSAAAGGTILPFGFTFPSVTLSGTHTYTVRIRSTGSHSVQLGTGDVTTDTFIIKEYNL